jgi:hypothetical protein
MLTLLCSPKPFVGRNAINQLNALRSWKMIHPEVEIIIFGQPAGVTSVAEEVGATLVPEIECSSTGAPSFNAMVSYANQNARYRLCAYVNCDILLNASFLGAITKASEKFVLFLMVGERVDLDSQSTIDVCKPDWLNDVTLFAKEGHLTLHGPTGIDYFGFMPGMWDSLPPVYMGRARCDQALLHFCLNRHIPIIDATQMVTAVHQYHDYSHVQGGRQEVFGGVDLNSMARMHNLHHSVPTIADADWKLTSNGCFTKGHNQRSRMRSAELWFRYQVHLEWPALGMRLLQRITRKHEPQHSTSFSDLLKDWSLH